MKKLFFAVGLFLVSSLGFGQTFVTKRVMGMSSPTEWVISDDLVIYRSLDPKIIKQGGGGETRLVIERVVKNPNGSLYYTEWGGNKIRITVVLFQDKYIVNYEQIDSFTGKITQMSFN
jgi:hypothetical protein